MYFHELSFNLKQIHPTPNEPFLLVGAEWQSKKPPKNESLDSKGPSSFGPGKKGPEVEVVCICSLMGRPGPERQIMKIRCFCGLFFPYCETFKLFPEGETEMLLV